MHISWHPDAWAEALRLSKQANGSVSTSAHDWRIYRLPDSLVALNSYTAERRVLITADSATIESLYFEAVMSHTADSIGELMRRFENHGTPAR